MENLNEVQVGSLVVSTQGRDKGRMYVVINVLDNNYVNIVDGNFKKLSNPKLKKIKHIQVLNKTLDKIASKLSEQQKVFDSEIYSAIRKEKTEQKELLGGKISG